MVQWLGLSTFTAGDLGTIPGEETKIPQSQAARSKKKKKRMVGARGWGEGEIWSCCLVEMEFQFGKMEKCWGWMVVMVAQGECT